MLNIKIAYIAPVVNVLHTRQDTFIMELGCRNVQMATTEKKLSLISTVLSLQRPANVSYFILIPIACHSDCVTCIGPTKNECIRCPAGKRVEKTS